MKAGEQARWWHLQVVMERTLATFHAASGGPFIREDLREAVACPALPCPHSSPPAAQQPCNLCRSGPPFPTVPTVPTPGRLLLFSDPANLHCGLQCECECDALTDAGLGG